MRMTDNNLNAAAIEPDGEIWVLVEVCDGIISPSTFELLGKAAELAESGGGIVSAVIADARAIALAPLLNASHAERIHVIEHSDFAGFQEEPMAAALAELAQKIKPKIILCAASVRGRSLAPRLATILGTGLTADCTGLQIDTDGRLSQTRPAFGGDLMATITCRSLPRMATVRPGVFQAKPKPANYAPRIIIHNLTPPSPLKEITKFIPNQLKSAPLADARIVVAIGRGAGGPRGVALAAEFADSIGAALGASRAVVDAGWLDSRHQVGQTGITIHPDLYIACGISGAVQHLVGMSAAKRVIAINRDADAPIFSAADFGVVGDLFEVLPCLREELVKQS